MVQETTKEMKVNPKNFTESQVIAIALRQECKCAVCGKTAASIIMAGGSHELIWAANIHHIKPKSALTKKDLEKHGTAGSITNGVLVCQNPCHDKIHDQDPELARFRTRSFQEIGDTEEDLRRDGSWKP